MSFVEEIRGFLEKEPVGRTYFFGGCAYIYLSRETVITAGEGWMEATISTSHRNMDNTVSEEDEEKRILSSFREKIGLRLLERGWKESGSRTVETTVSGSELSGNMITEVIFRFETADAAEAYEEIRWLVGRSSSIN